MANLDMESCEWLIEHRNDPWVKNHRAERLKRCLDQQEKEKQAEDERIAKRARRRMSRTLSKEVDRALPKKPGDI